MRILIIAEYFPPEEVGSGVWIHQLAVDLAARRHAVTVLTAFPNYPHGKVFPGYRRQLFQTKTLDGIQVRRTYIYATPRKSFVPRALSFSSFCASALLGGLALPGRFDVVYAILPPLPLGVTAALVARAKGAALVVNVQDLYPYIAVATGYLTSPLAIHFFERMEQWIYRRADQIVVISEGFRENLLQKGVPPGRLTVVGNWADPDQIRPGPRQNRFRQEIGSDSAFTLIYSGGLGHNTALRPLLAAAEILRSEPFRFVIVGEGAQKKALVESAREKGLSNVTFCPFQPLSRYEEVLAAADATVVTLSSEATFASVPSKVYKHMAAGRPIFAITEGGNELQRLLDAAQCGFCIPPGRPEELANSLRYAAAHPGEMRAMGGRARQYLEENCSRAGATRQIEAVLNRAAAPVE